MRFALVPLLILSFASAAQALDPDDPVRVEANGRMDSVELVKPRRAPRPARPATTTSAAAAAPSEGGQYGSRRIQVFLVPVGETAALAAGPTQLGLESEVARLPGFVPVDLVQELAVPPPAEERALVEEARQVVAAGNELVRTHQYEEAANRFRHAIRLLERAGTALDAAEYAEAIARLGAALLVAGEDAPAREALQMAARIDQQDRIDVRQLDPRAARALDEARAQVAGGPSGALSVVTSPPGARVFLGGAYRGTTPLTIDRVAAGVNFLLVDRPGAFPIVQLVDVKPANDTPVRLRLTFTPETLRLQQTLTQVPRELSRGDGVPDMVAALGRRFRLERAVVSTVEMRRTNLATVRLCVFDFPRGTRLVDETESFPLDVEGGLDKAVAMWARLVFDKAEGSRNRSAADPLDRTDGTEAWYSTTTVRSKTVQASDASDDDADVPEWERSTYEPKPARKKGVRSADPLNHFDGTEDW